jgi:two-component system OmpR family response regulator
MSRLLIVEDDATLARALNQGLREEGYFVVTVSDVPSARSELETLAPDLVILDLSLPGEDGLVLLKELRAKSAHPPVIIITARGLLSNRVDGLNRGADDYLVKPFAVVELVARIEAVLRRTTEKDVILQWGALRADFTTRVITVADHPLELTGREFTLLLYLMKRRGQPASREMLAREVWQVQSRATSLDNVIDVSMSRLRRKLGEARMSSLIETVRGVGYRLGEPS